MDKIKLEQKGPVVNNVEFRKISPDCIVGYNTLIYSFTNLYGCEIGNNCKIGTFVEIQKGAKVGNNSTVSSHSFICSGVEIGDGVFIGHGVMFINDNSPRILNEHGEREEDWSHRFVETKVGDNVTIGSNATILGGITIGDGSTIGAGSVVTKNVPPGETWVGNPARKIEK